TIAWVDYSQCSRLVEQRMTVNDQTKTVTEILADPALAGLLSDENPISIPRYPPNAQSTRPSIAPSATNSIPNHTPGPKLPSLSFSTNVFQERLVSFTLEPGIRVQINEPAAERFTGGKKVSLVFYALPNGNTTAQTIGRAMQPGDDWHYDI